MQSNMPKMLAAQLESFAVLRGLLQDEMLAALLAFLKSCGKNGAGGISSSHDVHMAVKINKTALYCDFVAKLYEKDGDLGNAILTMLSDSENPAVRMKASGKQMPPEMEESLARELLILKKLTAVPPAEMAGFAGGAGELPLYASVQHDFAEIYNKRLGEISTKGYGIFAGYHMFTLAENGSLLPVKNPDPQRLCELTGYENERSRLLLNTKALLCGMPANNILLYGDAGTGKSSTVKALCNDYKDSGLRLVEVRKNQLYQIPQLMDMLAENPLKFILFIDDLSFPADDAEFTALKAILEGNVSARPKNIVVYATSNRRHMVRQLHENRRGTEVHVSDTLEEESSLSARFGLTITFLRPDKELYAEIVRALAAEYGVRLGEEKLIQKAEAHALRHGGRSPRTARQFVELVKAEESVDS